MELTFIDNDFAIAVSNYLVKDYTIEQAIAQVHIDQDDQLAVDSKGVYARKKAGCEKAAAEWKRINTDLLVVRESMLQRYSKENLTAYICAKKADRLEALLTGKSKAPKYGTRYNAAHED